jgi:hypothetical protein
MAVAAYSMVLEVLLVSVRAVCRTLERFVSRVQM